MSASCLYEPRVISRVPRVAFDSNEVGEQQWSVVAVARPHSLCVAAANMLHIILDISKADSLSDTVEEPGHSGVPIVFEFKCSVDAVGWSSDGVLLVAGDRQGVLHFVSPAIEKVLFSQGLESAAVNKNEGENEPVFKAIKFAPTLTEGVMDLLVLCSSGVVFIFRNVGIRKIIEAMEKSDGEALKKLRGEIELIKLDLSDVHSEGSSSLHPLGLGSLSSNLRPLSLITCGTGESALCVWQRTAGQEGSGYVLHDNVGCLLQGLGIVKCETTRDDRFLATLDSSGMLEVWLLSSLIVVNVWTSSEVKHFSLCQGLPGGTTVHSESTGCTDRLCLITESSAGKELRIVSLPDFDPIHSMPVASAAALFTGTISEDSLYYLDIDDSEEKSAIVVKQLVLALPENRLATLLSQQKFEEAEAFARKFDLDPEMVYKSKAKVLNGLLCRAGDEEESETATTSLFRCLGHIKENAFVVNLVLCSLYPTLESTLQLLQFTHKKLQRGGSKSNDTSSIKAKVALALNKLVTFQMIDSDERFNPQAWQLFQEGTLLQHLRHYLQLGDLQKAGCIWSRHSTGLVNELDANNLLPLLECIPDSVPSLLLTSWLAQNIVPFLLQHVPQALRGFLLFVEERVRLLELTEKEHWPKNGLNMSSTLIESITSFRNPAAKMAIQPHSLSLIDFSDDHSSPLSSLRTLQKRLNDLCYLHSSLKCPITLSDHEKESQEAVVFRLLDEVIAAELVTTTIRSKVIPYVDRHKLQLDTTLLNYIKLFLSHSPRYSTGLTDSPFESKAIALVQAIQDKELYVLGCVELLKHVHTPWSESVEDLVQECLKVDHPVGVAMLEKQYSLLQLKKLLHGYGIRDFNFSDTSKGWLYIRRILISEGSSVLEDALKVGEMYQLDVSDIYKHHLMNLGQRDNMGEASQLLESLGREEQVTAAQKTFSLASSVLHLPFSAEMDDPDEYIGAAKVSVLCLKTLDTALKEGRNCVLCEDWTSMLDLINLFQRLLALQVEFSLFLSPAELGDGRKCRQLFTERVKHLPTVILSQPTDNSAKHYHDAIRYCHLLGFSEEEFYEELALVCAKQNKQDQAMDVCWDLVKSSPQPSVALVVMAIVQEVWERALSQPESINREDIRTVRQLAAYATALCHQSALLDTVEMYRLCVFIDCLYQQCESGVGEDRNNSSDFLEWRWSPRFKEDGLILDQSALLSTALRYTLARLPLKPEQLKNRKTAALYCCPPRQAALSRGTIQSLLSITAQLSQVLQDNGHNQLTLQCSTQTLAAYSQHTATMAANSDSSSYPILQQGQSVNRELLNSLVTKILSSRRLDHDYALSLLLMLPPHLAVDKLKAIRTRNISSFSKVIALCKLTIDYSIMVDDPSVKDHSVAILTSAQWGKRLGGHKISFTEAFRGGMEEKKKVASTLFRSKHVDTELILDYCREMLKFDPQAALATYLRILLTEWEDIHACQERAAAVIRQMKNRDVVNQMLLNLLMNKIKPYDYDRIAFILSHLVGVGVATTAKPEQGLVLLDCLRRYTRVSPPSEYEKSLFSSRYAPQPTTEQEQPVEVALPAAALKHLPFHLLLYGAPMKVIEAELLSSANVEKLIPISRILQLPIDDFYCCAIKRIVTVSQQSNKGELDFPLLSQFLVKIQKFQYALEVCKWLAKQLPKEEDRTEILKSGLDLSMQYRSQATTEQEEKAADEKASMFHELWRIAQTDQVLKRHNLDTPEYLEMSRLGASLILTLYTDLPVARTTAMVPVHSIAAEIAKIHNINLDKIISKLTEKWLLSTNSSSTDMNVTQSSLLEDPTEDGSDVEESEETLNTRRLVYLLGVPEKLEKHSIMLLRWAQQTSSSAGSLSRVRALQILFTIAPSTLIERASGKSVTDIKDLMQSTMFVAELEALHMSTKISAFQACNKEGLVRTLWRNHSQEPRALRLICELCLYYHIRDPSLWANLLEQLLSLEMLPYLRHVLKVLASLSGLSNITSLASVWQRTLMSTFQGVAPPLSDYQKQEGTNTLEMMYSCPFPFELDVGEVVMGFCSVDLHTHALASLLIVPSQIERSRLLNRIMKCFSKKEQYVLLLDKLAGLCRTTCGHFKEAIELVYVYLNSSEKHELLLGSSHFTPFMHYLISKKLMKSLVTKTLQLNRVKDAVQLVEIYNSKHNPQTQIHGLDALQDYLTMNGINGFDASLLLYES